MLKLPRIISGHLHFLIITTILLIVMTFPTIVYVFKTDEIWIPSQDADLIWKFWDAWYYMEALEGHQNLSHTTTIFYPEGVSLHFYNFSVPHILLLSLLQLIMPITNAYNLIYLLILFLNCLATYIYILYVTKDKWGSLFGSVVAGFGLYVVARSQHPDLITIATIPLTLYFLDRAIQEHRPKLALIAGILVGITTYIGLYILICLAITVGIYLLFLIRQWRTPIFWICIATLAIVSGIMSMPRLYPMIVDKDGLSTSLEKDSDSLETYRDLLNYFINDSQPITGNILQDIFQYKSEKPSRVYLGYVAMGLILLGFMHADFRRSMFKWGVILTPFLILRLGSFLTVGDITYKDIPLPKYYLNDLVPVLFKAFHVSEHFAIGILLPFGILASYGVLALLKHIKPNYHKQVILLLITLVAFEMYMVPNGKFIDPKEYAFVDYLSGLEDQNIHLINLPMGRIVAKNYIFYQTMHEYPQVEGVMARPLHNDFQYIDNNLVLSAWRQRQVLSCDPIDRAPYEVAAEELIKDGFTHILYFPRFDRKGSNLSKNFLNVEPVYQDEYVSIYTLDSIDDNCKT